MKTVSAPGSKDNKFNLNFRFLSVHNFRRAAGKDCHELSGPPYLGLGFGLVLRELITPHLLVICGFFSWISFLNMSSLTVPLLNGKCYNNAYLA